MYRSISLPPFTTLPFPHNFTTHPSEKKEKKLYILFLFDGEYKNQVHGQSKPAFICHGSVDFALAGFLSFSVYLCIWIPRRVF